MILRYSSNPTGKSRTKCKFFFRWPILLYCFYTELACISNLSSLSLLLLLDIAFLLIMLLFFLFLVSGHYGPDAFFNSGCKCMLIFSDYLINHQKFLCLLSLTFLCLKAGERYDWTTDLLERSICEIWLNYSSASFRVSTIVAANSNHSQDLCWSPYS